MLSPASRTMKIGVWQIIALLIVCSWLGLELAPVDVSVKAQANRIQSDTGCGYIFSIPRAPGWPLLTYYGDNDTGRFSNLRLFENGIELRLGHALHADIRAQGNGRYSHWHRTLYFSASDCSNPIANGRDYRVEIPLRPSLATRLLGILALLTVLALSWQRLDTQEKSRWSKLVSTVLRNAIMPTDRLASPLAFLVLAAFLIAGSLIYLLHLWSSGKSVSLSVAGFYQISDASYYWVCSNFLLDSGIFGNVQSGAQEWCQRRSIYPYWLAGVVALGGRTIQGTLIVQAAVVSLALGLFVRHGIRLTGWIGGLLICALFISYFHENSRSLTMSENAGLAFGLAGAAVLLRAAELHSARWVLVGCAFVSIALNARAGAFFVLPMLILWGLLVARLSQQRLVTWGLHALVGCSAGFLLQFILVWTVGGDPTRSHSNFAYVLYGLSVGGLGWSQVLTDHPELLQFTSDAKAAKLIYGWAFSNMLSSPWLFAGAIAMSLRNYLRLVAFGHDIPLLLSKFATYLWYLSWIPLWQQRRSPPHLLIGLSALGVLLSAPFLMTDGGPRIFAATLPFDAIQMSIGLIWVVSLVVNKIFPLALVRRPLAPQPAGPEAFFVGMLVLLILTPFAYRALMPSKALGDVTACKLGEFTVVTRIGYESPVLDLTESGQKPDFMKGEVYRVAFVRGLPPGGWWVPGVEVPKWKSILLGQQLNRSDLAAPGPYTVVSDEHLAPYFGKTVRICVSAAHAQELFGQPYRTLESIEVIN